MAENPFDEDVAARYDATSADMFRPEVLGPAVDFLVEAANGGAALEFGVGTGRLALPLSERGVEVHGIDSSLPMLEKLRAKPGSGRIEVTAGDMATTRVEKEFDLVYLAFNTITNLTSQEEQVACFENAAAHLKSGGRFVIEVYVPTIRSIPPGERVRPFDWQPTHFGFDEYTDFVGQILRSHHYWIEGEKMHSFSAPFRWVWPSELDLMARIAGMQLEDRFAGWAREPFTEESTSHVSVWRSAGDSSS